MLDFTNLKLLRGLHASPENGMCLLEAAAYVAGEPHSDSPKCVCPVIASFGRRTNDWMNDEDRQLLKPYIHRLIGSKSTNEVELKRAYITVDTAVKKYLPMMLNFFNKKDLADKLETLSPITDEKTVRSALNLVNSLFRELDDINETYRYAFTSAQSALNMLLNSIMIKDMPGFGFSIRNVGYYSAYTGYYAYNFLFGIKVNDMFFNKNLIIQESLDTLDRMLQVGK